jgi:hypothetical protein
MTDGPASLGEPTNSQLAAMIKQHMQEDRGWHLKKEIQLGHVITTLSVIVSVIWYAGKLEQRIALTEQQVTQIVSSQKDREAMLVQRLDKIEAKLDRLIEVRR